MREIKFRGLDEYGGFIYGNLFKNDFVTRIIPFGAVIFEDNQLSDHNVIDSNTIGQFTGLKDKNGKDIYEGDIIKSCFKFNGSLLPIMGKVVYSEMFSSFGLENEGGFTLFIKIDNFELEFIGNIHENSELLK